MTFYLELNPDVIKRAQKIKLLIMDVDGVLSDGKIYFTSSKEETKSFNIQDGLGIVLLHQCGIQTAIITGRNDECVKLRADALAIKHYHPGVINKKPVFLELIKNLSLELDECAYIGDDIIDLPIMTQVGFAVTVANGHGAVKQRSHYITQKNGGDGALRELCDILLYCQNHYYNIIDRYIL